MNMIKSQNQDQKLCTHGVTWGSSSKFLSCDVPFHGLPGSNSGTESSATKEVMDCNWFGSALRTSLASWLDPSDHPPTAEESLDQVGSGRGRTEMPELVFGTVDPGAREKGSLEEGSEGSFSKLGNFQVVLRRDCDWGSCFSELRSRKSEVLRTDVGSGPFMKSKVEVGLCPTGLDGMLPDPVAEKVGCVCLIYIAWFSWIWFWRFEIRCLAWVIWTCNCDCIDEFQPPFPPPPVFDCSWVATWHCKFCKCLIDCNNW